MKTATMKKIITIAVATMLVGGAASGAFAVTAAQLATNVNTLKTTNACVGCDFTGYNFATSGIPMAGKNLTNATLKSSIFTGLTSLSGMNITGATMNNMTSFVNCKLVGVIGLATVPPAAGTYGNAQFIGAIWVDGNTTKCKAPSLGTCTR